MVDAPGAKEWIVVDRRLHQRNGGVGVLYATELEFCLLEAGSATTLAVTGSPTGEAEVLNGIHPNWISLGDAGVLAGVTKSKVSTLIEPV